MAPEALALELAAYSCPCSSHAPGASLLAFFSDGMNSTLRGAETQLPFCNGNDSLSTGTVSPLSGAFCHRLKTLIVAVTRFSGVHSHLNITFYLCPPPPLSFVPLPKREAGV